jgi:hypothetical protein
MAKKKICVCVSLIERRNMLQQTWLPPPNSKGVIGVSVCGDFLNVFLKKSFSSQSLILSYVNEFVCQQSQIVSAVQANNDAVPRRQTVVSAERGKSRSFMRSSFEVRPTQ